MIYDQRRIERSSFTSERLTGWMDSFAICASAGCLIHCLALPLLLAALPALSGTIGPGESFHRIVLALAVPTSAFALICGYRRHKALTPLLTGLAGLLIMACAIAFAKTEPLETAITVAGSLLLAGAHIANWTHRRRAARPPACRPCNHR